jgi:hypothetical protein
MATREELFGRYSDSVEIHRRNARLGASWFRCKRGEALEWAALEAGSEGHCGTYGRTPVAFSAYDGRAWAFGYSL